MWGRRLQRVLAIAVGLVVVAVAVDSCVRVSDGLTSNGIIEEWLFGRSAWSALQRSIHSTAFNHWTDASELSKYVASVLTSAGPSLLRDPSRTDELARATRAARRAYEHSTAIPGAYLAASNPGLSVQYRAHFVEAMRLWTEGLDGRDQARVLEGIEHYNTFLAWMQAQSRDAFESLR